MCKGESDTRFSKGRQHSRVRSFKHRTSTVYETKNGASEEEEEMTSEKAGVPPPPPQVALGTQTRTEGGRKNARV